MAKKNIAREVKYLNKDFSSFRNNLIDYAKTYFPNTYTDFNESDPGMMFIEMASYVGDVLSYYIDNQYKESLLSLAEEQKSVFEIAQSLGYKPKLSSPAVVDLDVFQTVPSIGGASDVRPDLRYSLNIPAGLKVKSNVNDSEFRTLEDCNFKFSSSYDPMEVEIYEVGNDNLPSKYLLKKSIKASSGTVQSETFTFGSAEKYPRIVLQVDNVIDIISIIDSDSNNWYEVPFLAQDTIFEDVENNSSNDPALEQYNETAPYLLKLLKTPRRFTKFIRSDEKTELRFGAGTSDNPDEELIPNPNNVGSVLPGAPSYLNTAFDPSNFLSTRAYGLSPSNTILTVTYSYGGGIDDNVRKGSLVNISEISYEIEDSTLDADAVQTAKDSVAVTNPNSATGGYGAEPITEVKNNALAYFQAQNRAVTKEDYIVRTYSLPQKYGNIAKAFIAPDEQLIESNKGKVRRVENPFAMNLYVLGFDSDKHLTTLNQAVKENLQTYLGQYRMLTDAINIKNAWVVNIGIQFAIIAKRGYNKHELVLKCIDKVKQFFDIDKWQINQPIVLADLVYQLSLVDGVASVVPPENDNDSKLPIVVTNKWRTGNGYSGNFYNIKNAIKDSIIYPSVDPSIFEIKYPNIDIEGRVIAEKSNQDNFIGGTPPTEQIT